MVTDVRLAVIFCFRFIGFIVIITLCVCGLVLKVRFTGLKGLI